MRARCREKNIGPGVVMSCLVVRVQQEGQLRHQVTRYAVDELKCWKRSLGWTEHASLLILCLFGLSAARD